jgi:hypothetical protein
LAFIAHGHPTRWHLIWFWAFHSQISKVVKRNYFGYFWGRSVNLFMKWINLTWMNRNPK